MRILAIPGSTRRDSHNVHLLRHIAGRAPLGVEVDLWDGLKSIPPYDEDDDVEPAPPAVASLREAIAAADGIVIATPEYNSSIPGVLKNAIDWASRPWGRNSFDHIPAAVIGASIGQIGTAVGQQSLRAVLGFCNARQMTAPEAYITYSPDVFADDGEVTNESTREFLRGFMAEFRDHVARVLTVLPRE